MSAKMQVGRKGTLVFNAKSVKLAVAVFHYNEGQTVSIVYDAGNQQPSLPPFDMDGNGDDKMLVGSSKNVGSLVQLLWPLTGKPFYQVTNDHYEQIGTKLYVRTDYLKHLAFADMREVAGPMGY